MVPRIVGGFIAPEPHGVVMAVPSDRLSMDMAVNSPRAARVQHEYFLDKAERLSPSAWAILFLAILFAGLVAWYLTH